MTPLSGCCSVEIACRRACRSPRLPSVISFSTSGLTALALASVVPIPSRSISSLQRLRRSSLRCDAERLSWWRLRRWRMTGSARRRSALAQAEPPGLQRLLDLVDRLLAEVGDRPQLALALGDQIPDGLDARPLEAVVRAHPELELLDEDVVHPARGPSAGRADRLEDAGGASAGTRQLVDLGVGEDGQVADEDLGSLAQRRLGLDRAVGLDVHRELVEVGALADAGLLDRVGHAAHRGEDGVDGDDPDRLIRRLVVLRRSITAAPADRQVHLEPGLALQGGDLRLGVEDLDPGGQVDVLGSDVPGPGGHQRCLDLGRVRVHPADDALEVEDDVGDVLGHALDGRELVRDSLNPHAGDRGARQRREQDPAQRVAERVAKAALERLDRERATVILDGLGGDPGDLEVKHRGPIVVLGAPRRGERHVRRLGGAGQSYFEYSSTISCSWTGAAISLRSGLRSTLAVNASWSACSQAGTCPVSSVASRIVWSAPVPAFTAMTSPGRTW